MPLVETVPDKCRVCYTCVRECPAKAIRIKSGQAEVIPHRCIGCGNCIKVCTRDAKRAIGSTAKVLEILRTKKRVAAIVAPSFPAEFPRVGAKRLVGTIKTCGFEIVSQVAFGADLVAAAYRKLLQENPDKNYIAVTCPAIVNYVEMYMPELIPSLAPIVSPMVAEARVMKHLYGDDLQVVFIGPCVAKKGEAEADSDTDVDASLTFAELRNLISIMGIDPEKVEDSDFNPPTPGLGALFPINGGMLQAADMKEDLLSGEIVTADGKQEFIEALKEFKSGDMEARLLEILCCEGCIMGPGMTSTAPLFRRRAKVSKFVRESMKEINFNHWNIAFERCKNLNLDRSFKPCDQRLITPSESEITRILERMGKFTTRDELNCGACGYSTCREHAVAIFKGLAESEMCLPYAIEQLKTTVDELAEKNDELAGTKVALKHAEKMASMGQLAAGIAHEVNNPLGVVLMYAHTLMDENPDNEELKEDLKTITVHADRCKKIVAGLLDFARQKKVTRSMTNVPDLIEKTVRVLKRPETIKLEFISDGMDPMADVDEDQLAQVITNLAGNAIQAMGEKGILTIRTGGDANQIIIEVNDTGPGIPKENVKKIFEPFFTTKERGSGTGLGLAVTYGIVKMHRGQIKVESNADPEKGPTGTTFTVTLPRREPES
ncbi:histidine kinase [Candidatus Fermentibacteria bacterium]|nr:MAG: histidine kinase [Candidatus Fermentibacteria bacterium]